MDLSTSQCISSGCESGWTSYLDQSSISKNQFQGIGGYNGGRDHAKLEDEEEDLSMVSDASSGPPHYCEDDEYRFHKSTKQRKNKDHVRSHQQQCLDDTASSPVLNKKVTKNEEHSLEYSQGFSATHCKGKSSLKKQFGFFQSSKSASKEPDFGEYVTGNFQGRNWK
ncbi:hypothetical protein K2173_028476 [Erythroxylum novogranatense]|uniref:Uncharacterized protein n=1 Tax=Erythroxylum novogranatense TaxID=1862640 RepID=A0AAV8U516_9ROSI|nr:hypothetical protein K2173_028476 [Erythroxylum novogranatense]